MADFGSEPEEGLEILVSLRCVVKLYSLRTSHAPREHNSTVSLGTSKKSSHCCYSLVIEGPGIRTSIVKVTSSLACGGVAEEECHSW